MRWFKPNFCDFTDRSYPGSDIDGEDAPIDDEDEIEVLAETDDLENVQINS